MAEEGRVIRLRRPPVLVMNTDGPFVPAAVSIDMVDERWTRLCQEKPHSFDGRVCQVLGVHRNGHGGATIHAVDCAYRFHAVQDAELDLGVRALGVKAIVVRAGKVLLGLRSRDVTMYANMWEFAPGGMVEPGEDPNAAIRRECLEETGLAVGRHVAAVALFFDGAARTWEAIHLIRTDSSQGTPKQNEYQALKWMTIEEAQALTDLSPPSVSMLPLAKEIGVSTEMYRQP